MKKNQDSLQKQFQAFEVETKEVKGGIKYISGLWMDAPYRHHESWTTFVDGMNMGED
ncbi:MAG: hypothetical protein ACPG49_04935 [Chitinophagales bacterium]